MGTEGGVRGRSHGSAHIVGIGDALVDDLPRGDMGDIGTFPLEERMTAPAPVAVHWAVGGFCPPYSRGFRYCRSAEQKWEEVMAAA